MEKLMSSIENRVTHYLYGLTEDEQDFIIYYDIKCRMGDELNKREKK